MDHLGGHEGITHIDEGAFDAIIKATGLSCFVDIGCGPAGMVDLAKSKGILATGIDGDNTLPTRQDVSIVDFTKQTITHLPEGSTRWLGWSVEVVEHIPPEFVVNITAAFSCCAVLVMTHALPFTPGHHHVNCQPWTYWKHELEKVGMTLSPTLTQLVRRKSTMTREFMRRTGLVFVNIKQ